MKQITALTLICAAVVAFNLHIDINPMTIAIVGVSIVAGVVIVSFGSLLRNN